MLACISGCGRVIGCIVATSQRPARVKVRPAGPGGGCERDKIRPALEKWPKIRGLWRAGRVLYRILHLGPLAADMFLDLRDD